MSKSDLAIAVVCSSNMNRSMEAQAFLSKKGIDVKSFGIANQVRLPGRNEDEPNIYDFGTTYEEIYEDLRSKDQKFYTQNGLLKLLKRNKTIKEKPEKLQESNEKFDIIITCDEAVFGKVKEYMTFSKMKHFSYVHVINIDIDDNEEDAMIGAFRIYDIIQYVNLLLKSDDLTNSIHEMIQLFKCKYNQQLLHSLQLY